ncbi:HlyD family efflux transporter periplasmic adaptor subunit [Janthinobacterium sp. GW460P]|nr:HlyD family efflux transporter periplasmic adaptor subunit [Janthinobacterium sp. GW460P]MCC7710688.1 HlyD family efflux transporter periplasmic adaptor subunit [Janthinobacterium sp. GW460W]
MDRPILRQRSRRRVMVMATLLFLIGFAALAWWLWPRGLQVPAASVRIAVVQRGVLRDDVAARATAQPLHSVVLDVVENGRAEEVMVRDGALVRQGELLFRLSNPQRLLEMLAREAEHAQQISNLLNLRLAGETSRADSARRSADLAFAVAQAEKQFARSSALAKQGFVSGAALEEVADQLARQRHALASEDAAGRSEATARRDAIGQIAQAVSRLEDGLKLVNAGVDALAVRAPVAGRLADFKLQVGETVRSGQRLGRIDDIAQFCLAAQLDEYYLRRLATGRPGIAVIDGRTQRVAVSRIYPQVSDGKFTVELTLLDGQPVTLSPGQSVDVLITLDAARTSLFLPNDSFSNDTGGAWVFVLEADGVQAKRRAVRIGRRSSTQIEILAGLAVGEQVIVSSYAPYATAQHLHLTH